jgi:hypothetical protein
LITANVEVRLLSREDFNAAVEIEEKVISQAKTEYY